MTLSFQTTTRWLFSVCTGLLLCSLISCAPPAPPCKNDGECPNATPRCISGVCRECKGAEDCASQKCLSNGACASVEPTSSEPSPEVGQEPASEPVSSSDADAAEIAAEPVTEMGPEPQPEPVPDVCVNGTTRPCYPDGKSGCISDATRKYTCKGICATGMESCVNGAWSGRCTGATEPSVELCNGKDDDCDGQIDNGFANLGQPCDVGKGECKATGKFVCKADGSGTECDAKAGAPATEVCNGKDDDCDGQIDSHCGFFWAASAGGKNDDRANSIAIDSAGNLYITGSYGGTAVFGSTTLSSRGNGDVFVAKLSNQGAFLWAVSAGGTDADSATSIATDSSGNLYITGTYLGTTVFGSTTLSSLGGYDVFVAKLSNKGAFLWAISAGGGPGHDHAKSIATDVAGNLYITGEYSETAVFGSTTLSSLGGYDVFVAKLSNQGAFLWAVPAGWRYNDHANSIVLDSIGNLYVTGYYDGTAVFGSTTLSSQRGNTYVFVAKLSNQGAFLWAVSGGGMSTIANSIATDSTGNLYITGRYEGTTVFGSTTISSQGGSDVFVAKLSNQGAFLWAVSVGGTGSDTATSITTDNASNLYITGLYEGIVVFASTSVSSQGGSDVFVAKLSNQGAFLWAASVGGTGSDSTSSTATDSAGNLYITAECRGIVVFGTITLTSQGGSDIFVAKLR